MNFRLVGTTARPSIARELEKNSATGFSLPELLAESRYVTGIRRRVVAVSNYSLLFLPLRNADVCPSFQPFHVERQRRTWRLVADEGAIDTSRRNESRV